jgi:conjugative transfer region protein TrbK
MTMSRTALPRLAAAAFLIIAIVVAIIELGRQGEEAQAIRPTVAVTSEPFRNDLQRCQALGQAALEDQSCLDAWAEARRRFLTPGVSPDESE